MVVSCSAFGCEKRQHKGSSTSFHRFPLKNEYLLKRWIMAVKRQNFKPTRFSKLCNEHFTEDDFILKSGHRKLKPYAIPSVFHALPKHYQSKPMARETTVSSMEVVMQRLLDKTPNIFEKQRETVASQRLTDFPSANNVAVQTLESTVPTSVEKLRSQIKILHQKIRRQTKTITNLKGHIDTLEKENAIDRTLDHLLREHFTSISKAIFLHLLKNKEAKSPAGHRYSPEVKTFSLTLHYTSPKAYEFCRSIFKLPHQSTLSSWM